VLFDGSFHVIHNFSREPSFVPAAGAEFLTSERLSMTIRSAFNQAEHNVQYDDVNRITGLESYDGSATFFWIQEWVFPESKSVLSNSLRPEHLVHPILATNTMRSIIACS
jgi:general transcription factor 3C protein 4